jgi:hypothetical protein
VMVCASNTLIEGVPLTWRNSRELGQHGTRILHGKKHFAVSKILDRRAVRGSRAGPLQVLQQYPSVNGRGSDTDGRGVWFGAPVPLLRMRVRLM